MEHDFFSNPNNMFSETYLKDKIVTLPSENGNVVHRASVCCEMEFSPLTRVHAAFKLIDKIETNCGKVVYTDQFAVYEKGLEEGVDYSEVCDKCFPEGLEKI